MLDRRYGINVATFRLIQIHFLNFKKIVMLAIAYVGRVRQIYQRRPR